MTMPRIKRARLAMFAERGGACCYCDGPTWLPPLEGKNEAAARLGIKRGTKHSLKMLKYARATFEHVKRAADGGTAARSNGMLACAFCNVARGDSDVRIHRSDMQALVAAGLHPVNRPTERVDNYKEVRKLALRYLDDLRSGKVTPPTGANR